MEITDILISHCNGDIRYVLVGIAQQISRLGQPRFLHQLGIGLSGFPLDLPGQPGWMIVQQLGQFLKAAADIVFLHIPQHLPYQRILRVGGGHRFRVGKQLHKYQRHGGLADFSLVGCFLDQDPEKIFQQILDGFYMGNVEIQVSCPGILIT